MGHAMRLTEMVIRGCDSQGCGHFGASRGTRKHNGIDLVCIPGTKVQSLVTGRVSKIGYPYAGHDKRKIRYVQVTCGDYDFRVFYVNPMVEVGQLVNTDSILGFSQTLDVFYPDITEHVHLEIKDKNGSYVDPTPTIEAMRLIEKRIN